MILGVTPQQITVALVGDADFTCTLESVDAAGNPLAFPPGTVVQLILAGGTGPAVTWTAAMAGNLATFTVDQVQVDATIAAGHKDARLVYVNGEDRLPWGSGRVAVW